MSFKVIAISKSIMLSVTINFIMLCVILMIVSMQCVIMLYLIVLNVVVPLKVQTNFANNVVYFLSQ